MVLKYGYNVGYLAHNSASEKKHITEEEFNNLH